MMDNNFNNLTGNNQTGSDQIRNSQMDNIQPERDGISKNMFDMQRNSRSMSEPSIENETADNNTIRNSTAETSTDFYTESTSYTEQNNTSDADSVYRYGRNFNNSTVYETNDTSRTFNNTAYDQNYTSSQSTEAEGHAWQPGTGAAYAEANGQKKKKAKRKKEKKPLTMGRVVRTCVAFLVITVLLNAGIIYAAFQMNLGDYVSASDYKKGTSILSTQSGINNKLESSSDIITANNSPSGVLSVRDVAKAVLPSVVSITSTSIYRSSTNPFMYGGTYQVQGAGSGIIIGTNDTELLIATNNHVVEDTTNLTVEFVDGTSVDTAYIKGTNSSNDIAVIAIKLSEITEDTSNAIRIATLGDSDELEIGDQVIAIGNALGFGQSVTVGYVSALNRELTVENTTIKAIQTDASINGGNSGGALINLKGEVIGINFAKQSSNGSSSSSTVEGMGYAIPISQARDIINELMNREVRDKVDEDKKGYMGIESAISIDSSVNQMYNIPVGAYLKKITENGPADKAGIQIGDVIIAIDGQEVNSYDDVQNQMNYYAAGDSVTLTIMRANGNRYEEKQIEVKNLLTRDELERLID
ncbi:MAG: trypsin-like peptidase domain-containing protein [Lachnospiraceae bacterium]|nr:trypsin-like peptidase domain-containing protein [Lachnospiraceae bacterium]